MSLPLPPLPPNPYAPREGWVIIYWDADRTRWEIGLGLYTDKGQAQAQRDIYARELGRPRARMVHTADGV
jgi:hypothetical protein